MAQNRNYRFKDVDMLLASKTIVENLKSALTELSMANSTWTEEYVTQLNTKIDDAIEKQLGLDKKKELRDTTALINTIQQPAKRNLSFIKTQIDVYFGKDSKEIHRTLGFKKSLRAVNVGDQEALIELLYSFKKGLTETLKAKLIEKGTNPALIESLIRYANQLKQANLSQESLKGATKILSKEAVNIFNEIYNEVIGICKIASSFYKFDTIKKEQFTFSKVIKNMKSAKKIAEPASEPA